MPEEDEEETLEGGDAENKTIVGSPHIRGETTSWGSIEEKVETAAEKARSVTEREQKIEQGQVFKRVKAFEKTGPGVGHTWGDKGPGMHRLVVPVFGGGDPPKIRTGKCGGSYWRCLKTKWVLQNRKNISI